MQEMLVLGRIPGTSVEVTFTGWLIGIVLLCTAWCVLRFGGKAVRYLQTQIHEIHSLVQTIVVLGMLSLLIQRKQIRGSSTRPALLSLHSIF